MERGRAGRFGLGYTAAVWAESRRFAAAFLREVRLRLGHEVKTRCDEAIEQYDTVAEALKAVSDAYPFKDCDDKRVPVDERSREVIGALKRAWHAEELGLEALSGIVAQLEP